MNNESSPQLGSFEGQHSKDPEEFFKQYRIQFNQSQFNLDSIHKIKAKRADEDEQVAQIEPVSLLQIQFDKIAISPIVNSRNSNISESNRIIQSDTNPIKHLGPYSNNLGSDGLNELPLGVGSSHLNPNSKFNNKSLDLDYSSYNQGSNQIQITPLQSNPKNITIKEKPKFTYQEEEQRDQSHQQLGEDKKLYQNGDYDQLYDYNYTDQQEDQQSIKVPEPQTIKEILRQSLRKMFNLLKIESATLEHEVVLNEEQYRLINDLSSDVTLASNDKQKSLLFRFINSLCQLLPIPSLNPSNVKIINTLILPIFSLLKHNVTKIKELKK